MFDATKAKLRDIDFQRINLDEDKSQGDKYGVQSIPRVVMLDAGGKVLLNASPARTQEGFEQMINEAGQTR